jgi:hypothetical protein
MCICVYHFGINVSDIRYAVYPAPVDCSDIVGMARRIVLELQFRTFEVNRALKSLFYIVCYVICMAFTREGMEMIRGSWEKEDYENIGKRLAAFLCEEHVYDWLFHEITTICKSYTMLTASLMAEVFAYVNLVNSDYMAYKTSADVMIAVHSPDNPETKNLIF